MSLKSQVHELDNILGDAQFAHRGLETDAVNDAVMDAFGYDETRQAAVYAADEPVFQTLVERHGFALVRDALRKAIEGLVATETPEPDVLHPGVLRSLKEMFKGQTFAFTAVVADEGGYGLGIAVQGEPGYWPVPTHLAFSPMWEAMNIGASKLNQHLGLSAEKATAVVTSTMAAQNKRGRRR